MEGSVNGRVLVIYINQDFYLKKKYNNNKKEESSEEEEEENKKHSKSIAMSLTSLV